ncbi:MAG TPA: hypothetical protein DCE41_33675 [Cytophagales bacterium]|nr:hypothetical protein [Cytophagales bacterium]HAA18671.1 hypothetical protein [Cytophagales bacterium]HAP58079.1 hypothetical protein [Cytophagales bacterium]
MKERLYYLDWLRLGAFAMLMVFHCTRFFDFFPWHVKNDVQSEGVTQFFLFSTAWRMPLIFFVSGAGTYFAIRSRKSQLLPDRVKRLLVPYLFGILVLIPPQKYLEYRFYGGELDAFWTFLLQYPKQLFSASLGWNFIWFGHLGYHIWYLPYLFVQTLVLLPVFRWINTWAENIPVKTSAFWLSAVTLVVVNAILRPVFPEYLNWADFFHFLFFFLMGYVFVLARKSILEVLKKNIVWVLGIAVLTSLLTHYFALFTPYMIKWMDTPDGSWDYLGFVVIRILNAFTWVATLLWMAHRYLNTNPSWLAKASQAILPVYVLHQTAILIIGYHVVQSSFAPWVKFLVILMGTLISVGLVYAVITRIGPLRWLFGMKPPSNT